MSTPSPVLLHDELGSLRQLLEGIRYFPSVFGDSSLGGYYTRSTGSILCLHLSNAYDAYISGPAHAPVEETANEEESLRVLYAEFAAEDRELADYGLADYRRMLNDIEHTGE